VPRKSNIFQTDIYPETLAPIAALSASEWTSGKNASPVLLSMKTASRTKTFKPVVYKTAENALVTSERNNDKKFMFLLEETKPDYRPIDERKENVPCPQIDHRNFGDLAFNQQKCVQDTSKVSSKDLKTCKNIETKFQAVQKKWVEGGKKKNVADSFEIYKTSLISGSNSVKSLTSRFDVGKEEEEDDEESLKQVCTAQQKQLYNLKTQVELRDYRINVLEEQVKLLATSRHATPSTTPLQPQQPTTFVLGPPPRNPNITST